jgi:nodulation protein F
MPPWDRRFAELVRAQLTSLPATEPLLPEADLRGLGLDSVSTIGLISELEEEYGFLFPDDALQYATFATSASLWQVVAAAGARQSP